MASSFMTADCNDFPSPFTANENGLLAIGSNLHYETMLKAYRQGIFPWYSPGEPICWYHPNPRFVLFPENLRISHSMRNVLNKNLFRLTVDQNFSEVIKQCGHARRKGQSGTWISDEIEAAYTYLYKRGYAHSAEAWYKNELVGGLYGVLINKVFFGESMFTTQSNAGKFAFIKMVQLLKKNGIELIDCQIYTPHLESLGATFISREDFMVLLKKLIP